MTHERSVTQELSCSECRIGRVAGIGQGLFCPLITRSFHPGDTLYRKEELATHAWFIKSGVIALCRDGGESRFYELARAGSFIGVEVLMGERYQATAHVISNATLCGISCEGLVQWLEGRIDRIRAVLRDGVAPATDRDSLRGSKSMRQKLTCPETAHLEEIEYIEDPVDGKILGILHCSAHQEHDTASCEAVCISRLNQRSLCRRCHSVTADEVAPDAGSDELGELQIRRE